MKSRCVAGLLTLLLACSLAEAQERLRMSNDDFDGEHRVAECAAASI